MPYVHDLNVFIVFFLWKVVMLFDEYVEWEFPSVSFLFL